MTAKYKRVLIKLSGEAVYGDDIAEYNPDGTVKTVPIIDRAKLDRIGKEIKRVTELGGEVAIVIGGGNIWRGGRLGEGFDRTRADHMGMLATVINSIALSETLENLGVSTRVMSSVEMPQFAETYIKARAVSHLSKKKAVTSHQRFITALPFSSVQTPEASRQAAPEFSRWMMPSDSAALPSSL